MTSIFRDGLLEGKTAFITGGTSGINLGIAKRFVDAGAKVTVLGRKKEKADAAVASLGKNARAALADVRDPAALGAAIEEAAKAFGEIDVLVCGAAGNFPAPAMGMSPNGFKAVVDIDLLGTFNAARLAFDHLRKPGAAVVAISAPQAGHVAPMQAHVAAAKAGVDMLVKSLALEWGSAGVRVNALWPGGVIGTEGMERLTPDEASRAAFTAKLPLGRYATADEIAEAALFVALTPYMTGSIVVVDGGMSLVGFSALMPL